VVASTQMSQISTERAQLDYFVQNTAQYVYILPMLILAVGGFLLFWAPLAGVAIWAMAAIISYLIFYALAQSPQPRPQDQRPADFRHWARSVVTLNAITQTIWVSMLPFFWVPDDGVNNVAMLAIITVQATVLVGYSSTYLPLLYSSLAAPALALVLWPISTGEPYWMYVAMVAAAHCGFLLFMGFGLNRTATAMLALRDEKDAWIKQLEAEKSIAEHERGKAQQETKTKSVFLASVSHELRTPLNAIIGFSDVMRNEVFGPLGHENYQRYCKDIHGSSHHLLSLIDDILDLARIEAGRVVLNEEPVDLMEAAAECLRMIEVTADTRGIELKTDIQSTLPLVFADARAIRQIWLNLASNAAKFTDAGDQVVFFATGEPDGSITFGVEDTGCGMDEEECAKVLDMFEQGQSKSRTGERGSGLGLAIVRGLAKAHGGNFALTSKLGEGTRAAISLPAKRAMANPFERWNRSA